MKVKWSRDFSIKNMQLDKQHELIFEITNLANDLALKIQENNTQYKDDLTNSCKTISIHQNSF